MPPEKTAETENSVTLQDQDQIAGVEKVVPLRHPWRWLAAAVILALVVWWARVMITTESFQWDVVGSYLFNPFVLAGVRSTILITVLSMVIGTVLGVLLAVMRLSPNPILQAVANFYLWFFRGTPTLLQLIFWFNLASVFPRIDLNVAGLQVLDLDTNTVMTPLFATLLGLGLNLGAYYSEIVRAGILSIDEGQVDAANAYGFTRPQTLRHIVLPQAMRVIVPPTGNELIGLLKYSSLASVISYGELLQSVQSIYTRTFEIIPLLIVAALWYLALTTVLSVGQFFVEQRFSRGTRRTPPSSVVYRVLTRLVKGARV